MQEKIARLTSTCVIFDKREILCAFSSFSSHLHNVILDILDQFSICFAVTHARSHARLAVGHKAQSMSLCFCPKKTRPDSLGVPIME